MSDVVIDKFIEAFTWYYGRAITIVSGRDSYSFDKSTHRDMLNNEGIYILLENVPIDNMRHKYDKATFVPADSVDRMLPTNNPNLVKSSYSLSASKLRVEMYKHQLKLYQSTPILIREVEFRSPRKKFRLTKSDWAYLMKYGGDIIFICTIKYCSKNLLVNVIRMSASTFQFTGDLKSKTVNLDLDGMVLKRINDMGYVLSTHYGVLTQKEHDARMQNFSTDNKDVFAPIRSNDPDLHHVLYYDQYFPCKKENTQSSQENKTPFKEGQRIKIVFPDTNVSIECTIMKCEQTKKE